MSINSEEHEPALGIDCIVVFGDSSSSGFGTGGRGYPVLIGEAVRAQRVENLAKFGQTTKLMVEEDLPHIASLHPDLVIVQAGMGDSLPHPSERIQHLLERFVPSTFHGVNGLERRAYFSGTRRRRAQQRVVATFKTTLKRTLISLTGGFTRSNPEEFRAYFDQLLTALEATGCIIVCIGLFSVDQRIFPKQHEKNLPFRKVREDVLEKHPQVIRAEIDQRLHRWDDFLGDHGHWNAAGHANVAEVILEALLSALPELGPAQITS